MDNNPSSKTTATEEACPDGTLDVSAQDGRLVLVFREAPSAPAVTITCGYNDCEMVLSAIAETRKRRPFFTFVLRRDAVKSEDRKLYFATIDAKRGRLSWEVAAPFGLAGYRWDMRGADLMELEGAAVKALAQEDAKP